MYRAVDTATLTMNYQELKQYIAKDMKMQHIYQPVMIKFLLVQGAPRFCRGNYQALSAEQLGVKRTRSDTSPLTRERFPFYSRWKTFSNDSIAESK